MVSLAGPYYVFFGVKTYYKNLLLQLKTQITYELKNFELHKKMNHQNDQVACSASINATNSGP